MSLFKVKFQAVRKSGTVLEINRDVDEDILRFRNAFIVDVLQEFYASQSALLLNYHPEIYLTVFRGESTIPCAEWRVPIRNIL